MKSRFFLGAAVSLGAILPFACATAAEVPLYSFGAAPDGSAPSGDLVLDKQGNLYGTTQAGGAYGAGTVFKLTPPAAAQTAWTETVLYSFQGGADGSSPNGSLVFDTAGNLYGTTFYGGASTFGTVFKLLPPATAQTSWTKTVLYSFAGGTDGSGPLAGVIFDRAGNLYGTTYTGGEFGSAAPGQISTTGTVYELSPPAASQGVWTEAIIHSFKAGAHDGGDVPAGLIIDNSGNLYGTTSSGGSGVACTSGIAGCGTVFRLSPPAATQTAWTESVLYNFSNVYKGLTYVYAKLAMDKGGNLYGTAQGEGANGYGGIFKLTNVGGATTWPETTLFSFLAGGQQSTGELTVYGRSLAGTSSNGGRGMCSNGCGTVFSFSLVVNKLATTHTFTTRHADGINPYSGIVFDSAGNGFGTASAGGATGNGMVFEMPRAH